MKKFQVPNIIRGFLGDAAWSVAGLVLMNVVAQFVVYPVWNRTLGSEEYGNIIFMISIMNIVAVSLGASCNYSRMRNSAGGGTNNRPYIYTLILGSIIIFPAFCILWQLDIITGSWVDLILFYLLVCATLWRTYADVEYRLTLNYKGYFCYYLIISVGYLCGIAVFLQTRFWQLALLPGELAGLVIVAYKGSVFRKDKKLSVQQLREVVQLILMVLGGQLLSNLIFNGDRLLLKMFISGSAVTLYYLASLLGKTMSLVTMPLNSVLIGYLSKYEGKFTRKMMNRISQISVAAIVAATVACTIGSHLLIPLLYPSDYSAAKEYFFIANLSQIFYFVSTVIVNSVMLRFAAAKFQIYVNVVYAVLFCVLCVPLTLAGEIWGFCIGLLIACVARFLMSLVLCYRDTERSSYK